ncbi:gamma-glutamylaminecyclotransferase B-like isoform X3 [Sebastes umbrosus]|uniref:gamma-glutamylaminecyclotransferase B-like isoform X3 n=1 Tax=Sebastes umbrosus TaxID=72105 RepID=UPI0018A113F5|nr:gamma-glutamylaminecyclotransferase B-like isoform X3 [Sebastes umbrosus]
MVSSCIHMARVFVYGTLKQGQPNYYRMFDSANGRGHRVRGEIYKVDDKMLEFLDDFESVPSMYQRTQVQLEVEEWVGKTEGEERPAAGSITEAFVYNTTTYQPDWPSLPSYESYDSNGDHGLQYAIREGRD